MKKICILAFTDKGRALAAELSRKIDLSTYEISELGEGENKKNFIGENFNAYNGFIFIGATGIAVRYIAPHLKSKDVDPAVISLDELGRYVIPLVSGHLGGANELAKDISLAIGAIPVLTTATDINQKFAIDLWTQKSGCVIEDISKIRYISGAILKGERVGLISDYEIEGKLPKELDFFTGESVKKTENGISDKGIAVSVYTNNHPFTTTLNAVPKIVSLGVGCRRNTDSNEFEDFIFEVLSENGISLKSVSNIGSIDLKKDEKCIIDFSNKYNIPFETATKEELNALDGTFTSSEFVKSITGVDSVCERAAVLFSENGEILMRKRSKNGMTCSIAIKDWKCKF